MTGMVSYKTPQGIPVCGPEGTLTITKQCSDLLGLVPKIPNGSVDGEACLNVVREQFGDANLWRAFNSRLLKIVASISSLSELRVVLKSIPGCLVDWPSILPILSERLSIPGVANSAEVGAMLEAFSGENIPIAKELSDFLWDYACGED